MSGVSFATCSRLRALDFVRAAFPGALVTDTPESAGPMLDVFESDIYRITDPAMHGRASVIPGCRYDSASEAERAEALGKIQAANAAIARATAQDEV